MLIRNAFFFIRKHEEGENENFLDCLKIKLINYKDYISMQDNF